MLEDLNLILNFIILRGLTDIKMQMQIKINGLKEVNQFLIELPKKLEKEIDKTNGQFMKDVRKSAKLRAPRYSGELANSIIVDKIKNGYILSVQSPYAYEQETGEGLPRLVSIKELTGSGWLSKPFGGVNASGTQGGLSKGGGKSGKKGFFIKRHYKPFVKPALEHNISKLNQQLSEATDKAIKKR